MISKLRNSHVETPQTEFAGYAPVSYTAPSVAKQPVWADIPESIEAGKVEWNTLDGKVDRRSHHGSYALDPHSHLPLNPVGRTGMTGRGLLGRFGPNHAAGIWVLKQNLMVQYCSIYCARIFSGFYYHFNKYFRHY